MSEAELREALERLEDAAYMVSRDIRRNLSLGEFERRMLALDAERWAIRQQLMEAPR